MKHKAYLYSNLWSVKRTYQKMPANFFNNLAVKYTNIKKKVELSG